MGDCDQFSVLMAFYSKDDPALFEKALKSVYSNTVMPAEVILVQDGPVPKKLSSIAEKYHREFGTSLITLDVNRGLSHALNSGLAYVTQPFVFRADADDYNYPYRFEKQLPYLKGGIDIVGADILEVDCSGNPIAIRSVPKTADSIRRQICRRSPFNHMTVGFRRSTVIGLGGYPDILMKEDYALWAKFVAANANMINLPEILVNATAGLTMYKRRGGLKYIRSEILLQRFLHGLGIQSLIAAFFYGFIRSMVFLMPSFLRGVVYEKILRRPVRV